MEFYDDDYNEDDPDNGIFIVWTIITISLCFWAYGIIQAILS